MKHFRNYRRYAAALLLAGAVCLAAMQAPDARAEERVPTEQQVKLAYLFNFAKFVEWPAGAFADPAAPIVLGVLGSDPFGSDLDALTRRTISARKVLVRRVRGIDEARACHVLFISASEQGRAAEVLRSLKGSGALLVSDMDRFAELGGMIGFVTGNRTVGFEINIDAVARAGITVHSRLLKMAVIVRDASAGEDD